MVNHANRGMYLERLIEMSAKQYAARGIAQVQKVPTPMKMPSKYNAIPHAYYSEKSTVDFIGGYQGKYLAFDAKETKEKRFSRKKLSDHQLKFLKQTQEVGGEAFLIIHFSAYKRIFKIMIDDYLRFYEENDRQSIPYDWFETNTTILQSKNGMAIDFLEHFTKTR